MNIMFGNDRHASTDVDDEEGNAMDTNDVRRVNRASLISVMLTAIVITVNHFYTLGPGALVLGAALAVVPAALFVRYEKTGSMPALIGYLLFNGWMVIGFGMKGLWTAVLPVFAGTVLSSVSAAFPKPVIGAYGFEMSGIGMFLGSLFVSDFGIQKVDTSGMNLDQDVIRPQLRVWHVASSHAIGASITIEDECLHCCCLSTTFPRPSMKARLHRRSACEA
jgi:hypothetical protein